MKIFIRLLMIITIAVGIFLAWFAVSESNFANFVFNNQNRSQQFEGFERGGEGIGKQDGFRDRKQDARGSDTGFSFSGLGVAFIGGFVKVALPTTIMILIISTFQKLWKKIKPKEKFTGSS